MGVDHVHPLVPALPAQTESRDEGQTGVFRLDGPVEPVVPLLVDRSPVFVSDLDVLQRERFGMAVLDPFAAPFGRSVAQCIVDGIERILDECIEILLPAGIPYTALTAYSRIADEHAGGSDVFAELQEFVVPESHCCPVSPRVVDPRTVLGVADRLFPFDAVRKVDAFHDAAARPADEGRMQGLERLRDVLPKSVDPVAERFGEERYIVQQ